MMRVEKALEAAGIECEVAGNSIQAPQARVPEVLRILKTLGLHYMGPQTRGNHTFNYNRTSKELGWIDYCPRRERIDFD
ncbi:hypothetical protein [Ralstonia phage phiRSL1]|uniref:Uncharacterized protein n=1 Tax=Ralstonia phage phiRSL1 TaxID=1980924 RepID=B2ZY28_9CAUD|nr:hypothetical protein RSL1_ORF126 [Ralstonia phage phiRSL1]BAG41571.1 hypothetical protein [Ralstonia phage phiRSL1]